MLLLPMLLLSGCATNGLVVNPQNYCGPNDVAIRLTVAEINALSPESAKEVLAHNEAVAAKGCAYPNR